MQIAPTTPEPTIQLSGSAIIGTDAMAKSIVDSPDGEVIELK